MSTVKIIEGGEEIEVDAADPRVRVVLPLGPPAPRRASGKAIRYALRALGVRDAWEDAVAKGTPEMRDWWDWTDPVVEDAPKLVRLCGKVGITPAALLDKAQEM